MAGHTLANHFRHKLETSGNPELLTDDREKESWAGMKVSAVEGADNNLCKVVAFWKEGWVPLSVIKIGCPI
jgi:hypothetical protein